MAVSSARQAAYPDDRSLTMKAAIIRRHGSPDEIGVEDVAAPHPGPDQVLVRVRAASMNPLDTKLRSGAFRPFLRLTFPAILGVRFRW